MAAPATRSSGATQGLLQTVRRRARPRSRLRWLKQRWRQTFPQRLPAWTGPVAGDAPRSALISRSADRAQITAESVGWLRSRLAVEGPAGSARGVDLVVNDWAPPRPGWSGRLGPLPGLVHHEVCLPQGGRGPATVKVTLGEPVPLARIVAAMLPALEPCAPPPSPLRADLATTGGAPHWLPAEASTVDLMGAKLDDAEVRPYDVRVATAAQADGRGYGEVLVASPYGLGSAGGDQTILVDPTTANPRGRQRYGPDLSTGLLSLVGGADGVWWQISRSPQEPAIVVAGRVGDPFDARQTAALLQIRAVVAADISPEIPPAAQAAAVAQLGMAGVVLHLPALSGAAAALLGTDLAALTRAALPDPGADPFEWEIRSIAQRRVALRQHATSLALPRVVSGAFPSLSRLPAVTALLVSRRPRQVLAAVAALAAQSYPDLEIVVGLHGCDLPADDRDRLAAHGLPVQVVSIPAQLSFGEALGEATRWARGSLITKVDDDDRYGPEHVWDLVLARHYSGAAVVGKGAEFVYVEPRDLTVRRWMGSELFTDVVAGGTIMLSRGDLEAVGGWRPLARSVDRGLLDRVLNAGGLVYRTHGLGFIYTRHGDGHTWDPGLDYFLHDPRQQWNGLPRYEEFGVG